MHDYTSAGTKQAKSLHVKEGVLLYSCMNPQNVTFRPTGKNVNRILMAKTLGINMSEVMNEIMDKYGDAELKKRREMLQKELERAKGFEPSTFTLAR